MYIKRACILTMMWLPTALQAADLSVHGLTKGSAVLKIDQKYVVLKVGERYQDYQLIGADENAATFKHHGKIIQIPLKNTSLIKRHDQNFIYNAHPNGAQHTGKNMANTHIISSRIKKSGSDSVTFVVDCFYNGKQGQFAQLRAYSLANKRETKFTAHTHTALELGRNQVEITLMMNERAPAQFASQQVRFEIIGSQAINGSYVVSSQDMPLVKTWSRPIVAPAQLQIGGDTTWHVTPKK